MTFSEKLCFLLNLAGVSNAELARAAGIDPSQVSRLKGGTRNVPKRSDTLERMADFFAARCQSDYQLHALADTLNDPSLRLHPSERRISSLMLEWFRTKDSESSRRLDSFLHDFSSFDENKQENPHVRLSKDSIAAKGKIYIGNDGRRAAFMEMLDYMLERCEPCEFLIASDESDEWLIEDRDYSTLSNSKMRQLSDRGFTFKRIASSFNDSDSALESLRRWMPIYMTGSLTSYYYPRLRDGVYRRTMCICPGVLAMVSSSVGEHRDCGVTHLTFDIDSVMGYNMEFNDYIAKCKPLVLPYIYEKNPSAFYKCLALNDTDAHEIMGRWQSLSCTTLPGTIISDLEHSFSSAIERENLHAYRRIQTQFEESLAEGMSCIQIIRLCTAEQVMAGKAIMSPSVILPCREVYYTVVEYRLHLMRIITLLEKYPNYSVLIDEGDMPDCELYVKDSDAAIFVRKNAPFTLFEVMEQNTIATCREYIMLLATLSSPSIVIQRRRALEKLRALYEALSQ